MDRFERYFMMASEGQTEARIVLSKTDMISSLELEQRLAQIAGADFSAPIFFLRNTSELGLDDFWALLAPAEMYCLLSSSSAGKTTLIKRLLGRDA